MNNTSWTQPVTHVTFEKGSAASQRWAAFHAWYEDLVKWVQAPAREETGLGPWNPERDAWLWAIGANIRRLHTRAEIMRRLGAMPEFPTEWPEGQPTAPIVERLTALANLQPVPSSPPYSEDVLSWHVERYADRAAEGNARAL